MGSEGKFCLRWNDFESNIGVAFREIRGETEFCDVTLACEDSQVQAHRVILSACSPFSRSVLRRHPHQHPLLYLKGVKYKEMLAILDFMYEGEVNVAQEELNSFLAVAEELKVKGLTQDTQKVSGSKKRKESRIRKLKSEKTTKVNVKNVEAKGKTVEVNEKVVAADLDEEHCEVKVEAAKVKVKEPISSLLEGKVTQLENMEWKCLECGWTRKSKYDVIRY